MFRLRRHLELTDSRLYNEQTFYKAFEYDLRSATRRVIIESPFITTKRVGVLLPVLQRLRKRGVNITINTRNPLEHDDFLQIQAREGIGQLQDLGITILFTGSHHRKIAIIDSHILWEGSLNILSQGDSCELMRRIDSPMLVEQMIRFVKLTKWYT